MRFVLVLIAVLVCQVCRAPARPATAVIVVAPPVPTWPCDQSRYLTMNRIPGPYDCLGCPVGMRGQWEAQLPPAPIQIPTRGTP